MSDDFFFLDKKNVADSNKVELVNVDQPSTSKDSLANDSTKNSTEVSTETDAQSDSNPKDKLSEGPHRQIFLLDTILNELLVIVDKKA